MTDTNTQRLDKDTLDKLTTRTKVATVEVALTPRDVAILVSLGNGAEQTDMAKLFEVHKGTVLKNVTRLYAKLGTNKATEAYATAGDAGAVHFADRKLTPSHIVDLYAAGDDWSRVGIATLADAKAEEDSDPTVSTRQATPEESEANAIATAKAKSDAKARG
jgi:DNA-binding CsgD family transcriptional regulator